MRCWHSGYGSAKQDNWAGNRPLFYLHQIYYNKKEKENNLTLINCRPFCRHFTEKTLFITIYYHLHLENKNAYNCR